MVIPVIPAIPVVAPAYVFAAGLLALGSFTAIIDTIRDEMHPNYYDADKNVTTQILNRVLGELNRKGRVYIEKGAPSTAMFAKLGDNKLFTGVEVEAGFSEGIVFKYNYQCKLKVAFLLHRQKTGKSTQHLDCINDCVQTKVVDCKTVSKHGTYESSLPAEKFNKKYRAEVIRVIKNTLAYMGENGHIKEQNRQALFEAWPRLLRVNEKH